MHTEILSEKQIELLPLIKKFSGDFGLVGGTAFALHLGHRHSIDFDLFGNSLLNKDGIKRAIRSKYKIDYTFFENADELTLLVNQVKITFFNFPFKVDFTESYKDIIKLPRLPVLSAMKAFALGKRAKWKDYVDLYFFLKNSNVSDISKNAKEIFGSEFNEKLFRVQLSYFNDVSYSEKIDYLPGFEVSDDDIKKDLKEKSLEL